MLIYFSSSQDYKEFLKTEKSSLSTSDLFRLSSPNFKSAIHKLSKLDVDLVADIIFPLYSPLGRPANDPAIYLRSVVLMLHLGFTSLKNWCYEVHHDRLLQYLIGSWNVPNHSSHYDFINRITHSFSHHNDLLPKGLFTNKSNSSKPKKGEKLMNFSNDDTYSLFDNYTHDGSVFDRDRMIYTLQLLFNAIAVIPSHDMGFIDSYNLVFSGDGSAFHIHASPFGHQIIKDDNILNTHRYSAKNADFGWDSDLGMYYFGYTLYNISYHNSLIHTDLPVFIDLEKASRHDALSSISSTARFLDINPELSPKFMCFDSASDSSAVYQFLRHHNIIPIIDFNQRKLGKNIYKHFDSISENGKPICDCGVEMYHCGYDYQRQRRKFRCPLKMRLIDSCPYADTCSPSPYGRTVYINDSLDMRLFGPVPYKTDKWKELYKNRTCTERINNRILNDYHLHQMRIREDSKAAFFSIFAAINIHLDAWIKNET